MAAAALSCVKQGNDHRCNASSATCILYSPTLSSYPALAAPTIFMVLLGLLYPYPFIHIFNTLLILLLQL